MSYQPIEHYGIIGNIIRAAFHCADPARGIDADLLLGDEFQDIASGHLPVLEETLSHSDLRQVVLTGTPKSIDNHLESVFRRWSELSFAPAGFGQQMSVFPNLRCGIPSECGEVRPDLPTWSTTRF
jgi:hypothetical protein